MYSKIIIATVNILLVGVKWDIKAINHCLSVLISVREIREIGSHKSWRGDSTLRLHSSWRYRFIVLKTHSGEWRMRASCRLPALNLLPGRFAPPTDGGGGVVCRVQVGNTDPSRVSVSCHQTAKPSSKRAPWRSVWARWSCSQSNERHPRSVLTF